MARRRNTRRGSPLGSLSDSEMWLLLEGEASTVRRWLDEGPSSFRFDRWGRNPLLLLVLRGDPSLTLAAIDRGLRSMQCPHVPPAESLAADQFGVVRPFESFNATVELLRLQSRRHVFSEAVIAAASAQPSEVIEALQELESGKLDAEDVFGANALHYAVLRGDPEIVEMLLRRSVSWGSVMPIPTPLALATLGESSSVFRIVASASSSDEASGGRCALELAAGSGNLARVAFIMECLCDESASVSWVPSAMIAACRADYPDVAEWLLRFVSPLEVAALQEVLAVAAETGHERLASGLLEVGVGPEGRSSIGALPAFAAARAGRARIIELLLSAEIDPNAMLPSGAEESILPGYPGRRLLTEGAAGGNFAVVERLLAAGADPNVIDPRGVTARAAALAKGHWLLADNLPEGSAEGAARFALAGAIGSLDSGRICQLRCDCQDLLRLGPLDEFGAPWSTAAFAVRVGDEGILEHVLEIGAPRDAQNPGNAWIEAAKSILAHGGLDAWLHVVDSWPESVPVEGWSALHVACWMERVGCAAALLRAGADVDFEDDLGIQPLHLVAFRGNRALWSMLTAGGAQDQGAASDGTQPSDLMGGLERGWHELKEEAPVGRLSPLSLE